MTISNNLAYIYKSIFALEYRRESEVIIVWHNESILTADVRAAYNLTEGKVRTIVIAMRKRVGIFTTKVGGDLRYNDREVSVIELVRNRMKENYLLEDACDLAVKTHYGKEVNEVIKEYLQSELKRLEDN